MKYPYLLRALYIVCEKENSPWSDQERSYFTYKVLVKWPVRKITKINFSCTLKSTYYKSTEQIFVIIQKSLSEPSSCFTSLQTF